MGKTRLKLLYREIPTLRQKLYDEQQGNCALCEDPIIDDAVLDHDHKTGHIRCVLHRGCNALLGKIENNMIRNRVDLGKLEKITGNLIGYITAEPMVELLHPTYKTKEERKMKAYKKKKGGGKKRGY